MQIIISERALVHSPEESLTTGNKGLDSSGRFPCMSLLSFSLLLSLTPVLSYLSRDSNMVENIGSGSSVALLFNTSDHFYGGGGKVSGINVVRNIIHLNRNQHRIHRPI